MSPVHFSIIIPTYNRAEWLIGAIESVLVRSDLTQEVIIVDDGSTDNTAQVLRKFGDRIKVLTQRNLGPGRARNLGAKAATGEYLAFLDSDDVWFPWTLSTYLQIIEKYSRPAFIAGSPFMFSGVTDLRSVAESSVMVHSFSDYLSSGDQWRWWGVSSFVVRRDAFESVGGFADEWINGEDADLAMKLGVASGFVQITQPATFGYRSHETNETKNAERSLRGVEHMLRTELAGDYHGGPTRQLERWRIICRHAKPMSLTCLDQGWFGAAWRLYQTMFYWNMALGNWKYLIGFPVKTVFSL